MSDPEPLTTREYDAELRIAQQQATIERLVVKLVEARELIDQLKRDAPTELERLARNY